MIKEGADLRVFFSLLFSLLFAYLTIKDIKRRYGEGTIQNEEKHVALGVIGAVYFLFLLPLAVFMENYLFFTVMFLVGGVAAVGMVLEKKG